MIAYITLISITILFLFGIFLIVFIRLQKRNFGIPKGKLFYMDSQEVPGELLSAKTVPLFGKPDYLVKQKAHIIPIEKKTGKTPSQPYRNHIAQVLAYCFLVEEHFGTRAPYGIITYPNESFSVVYQPDTSKQIKRVVTEILTKKISGREKINDAHICRLCRESQECNGREK